MIAETGSAGNTKTSAAPERGSGLNVQLNQHSASLRAGLILSPRLRRSAFGTTKLTLLQNKREGARGP